MFLIPDRDSPHSASFPRVRGDVPWAISPITGINMFSPRARGCSEWATHLGSGLAVFPACAGMFRCLLAWLVRLIRFPRVRGDVPVIGPKWLGMVVFSPRARGCSYCPRSNPTSSCVFPACAGMFRVGEINGHLPLSFPRVRGDVPDKELRQVVNALFSPRARGCSYAET